MTAIYFPLLQSRKIGRKSGLCVLLTCFVLLFNYNGIWILNEEQYILGSCNTEDESSLEEYINTIKQKREVVLKYAEKLSSLAYANFPLGQMYVISEAQHEDYFQQIHTLGKGYIKVVKYSCATTGISGSGTGSVKMYYKWSVDPQLCSIKHEAVPQDCSLHSRYHKTLPGRNIESEEEPRDFQHYSAATKPNIDFHIHIIPYGHIDNNGNVATNGKIIMPHSCQKFYPVIGMDSNHHSDKLSKEKEVFVISQHSGERFFHTSVEVMTRLVVYLQFLRDFPHIRIHVNERSSTIHKYFKMLGLDVRRMVSGPCLAEVVYLPQGGGCDIILQPAGQMLSNTYHHYIVQQYNKQSQYRFPNVDLNVIKNEQPKAAGKDLNFQQQPNAVGKDLKFQQQANAAALIESKIINKPLITQRSNIILIHSTLNGVLKQQQQIASLLETAAKSYNMNFIAYNDNDDLRILETIDVFYNAVLIVAPQGGGLANILFSKPGSYVIEIMCRYSLSMTYKHLVYTQGMRYHGLVSSSGGDENCDVMDIDLEVITKSVSYFLDDYRKNYVS